jgi:hypothetical protein
MTSWRTRTGRGRRGWTVAAAALLVALAGGGQGLAQERPAPQDGLPQAQGDAELVACLLPADITRYGQQLTVAAPRRQIQTTREDCEARAGEVVGEAEGDSETAD